MQTLISVCAVIICLICVIGVHELGHGIAAKIFGVKIQKISLGFGRPLFGWQSKNGYIIELCPLLIGGRVQLYNNRVSPVSANEQLYCFDKQPLWIRIIILLSGSFANLFLAFVALIFMLMLGFNQLKPMVAEVIPNSNAAVAGLEANSQITSIANHKTSYFREVAMQLIMHVGQKDVEMTICNPSNDCKKTKINLDIINTWNKNSKDYSLFTAIGFTPQNIEENSLHIQGVSFNTAFKNGFAQLIELTNFFAVMIKQILSGHIPFATLIGPFKFFEAIIDSFAQGLATFFYFIANFSLAMAIANLIPIPTLDGGAIIYGFIEKIRGKPMSIALEILIYRLVFIAFTLFIVQLIVNDLKYYF